MKIDYKRLSRNYTEHPIKAFTELCYDDIYYLYWELNLTKKQVSTILGCSDKMFYKYIKEHKLIKSQEMITESQKNLMLERYGTDNIMKTEKGKKACSEAVKAHFMTNKSETIRKRKQTWMEKYGTDNPSKSDKIKQKKQETCLKNYGVDNPLQNSQIKTKVKQTFKDRYGDNPLSKNSNLQPIIKQRIKDKYGVDNVAHNKEISIKKSQTLRNKTNEIKENNIKNLGVEWPSQLQSTINKINKTKKQNETFNKSVLEENTYRKLLELNKTIIRQYSCEKYPFCCDFYIKEDELFIECNYHWTHGGEPFNAKNRKHVKKVQLWQQRNTKYYENAVRVWTIKDVLKLETAKQNGLNYKCFYSFKEFTEWVDNCL